MAYTQKRFLTVEFIKEVSQVDFNCDASLIKTAIYDAQRLYIKPALGSALYDKLCNDSPTFVGVYATLMDQYIVDALVKWTLYLLAPKQAYKWRDRAIDQQSGENSTPAGMDEIRWLQSQEKQLAESYMKDLNDYLLANWSSFPELNQNNTIDKKQPNGTSYTVPMHLGPDYGCNECEDRIYR